MGMMIRHNKNLGTDPALTLNTALNTTPEIDIAEFGQGEIYIPSGSTITSLTFNVCPYSGGVYLPAQDTTGAAVTLTVAAAKAYPLPAVIFGAALLKIVTNAAGAVFINLKA